MTAPMKTSMPPPSYSPDGANDSPGDRAAGNAARPATTQGAAEGLATGVERPDSDGENGESLFDLFKPRAGEPPRLRTLRYVVIAMGVLLLVMFMAVIGRLAYILMRPVPGLQTTAPPAPGLVPMPMPGPLSPEVKLHLPQSARIKGHTLTGNRLSVHYEGPGGEGIMILDLESGRPASHVRIEAPRTDR